MTNSSASVRNRAYVWFFGNDLILRISVKVLSLALLAPIFLGAAWPANAQNAARIEAAIPVRPAFAEYTDLLAAPSYMLVALDNARASPLSGGRVVIQDVASFRYRIIEGRFTGRQGSVYRYEGKLEWNLAVTTAALTAAVEIDTTRLVDGTVSLRASFPLASLLPAELSERIQTKLALIGDLKRQDQLLAYLAGVRKRMDAAAAAKPTMGELILIDAHNQSMALGSSVREPGDAELLSDQVLLIITLLIWLVAVPAAIVMRRRYLAKNAKRGAP